MYWFEIAYWTSKFEELWSPAQQQIRLKVKVTAWYICINRRGFSQGSCIPNIHALSFIPQKIWARLKFLWQTDGRMSFNELSRKAEEKILRSTENSGSIPRKDSEECMCRLRNIAIRVWQTDGQTDRRTMDKVIPMCRYIISPTDITMQRSCKYWLKSLVCKNAMHNIHMYKNVHVHTV